MLCACRTSVHRGEAQKLHADQWHSVNAPAAWRMVAMEEHEAAGWGVEGYPAYVTA
jgi:hypothetical protein